MRRISTIQSSREANLEERREELRNLRWARRRNQIVTLAIVASLIALLAHSAPHQALQLVGWLL